MRELRQRGLSRAVMMAFNNFGGASVAADPLTTSAFYAPLTKSLVLTRGTGNPTYTRATTAYVTDFEGLLKQVPSGCARFSGARFVRNGVSTTSEDFSNAAWLKVVGCTVTGTQQINFDGTAVARCIQNTPYADARTVTVRLRAKIISGSPTGLKVMNVLPETAIPLTSSYQNYSFTGTLAAGVQWGLIDRTGQISAISVTNIQIEDVTGQSNQNPSEYVSVGVLSAPYHGAGVDGCKYFDTQNGNTVASNVVTEATGASIAAATLLGYQAEGARTNRCLHSQDFSNAAWVSGGGGIAVATNSIAAPDGTTTADTLTASGANGTLIQDLGVVASAAKAGGLWLKRKTGTGNIDITLDGGATWTTVAVTSSWARFEKTQTLADEDFGVRIVTSGDAVYAWQGQVETASFLSTDIPTTNIAVARNADVLSYQTASNISSTTATIYAEVKFNDLTFGNRTAFADTGGASYPMNIIDSTTFRLYDGATNADYAISALSTSTVSKLAVNWSSGTSKSQAAANGALGTPTGKVFDGSMNFGASIGVFTNFPPYGTVKNVRFLTSALTDAQLVTITTP